MNNKRFGYFLFKNIFFLIFFQDNKIKHWKLYLFHFNNNEFKNNSITTFISIKFNKTKTFYIYKICNNVIFGAKLLK